MSFIGNYHSDIYAINVCWLIYLVSLTYFRHFRYLWIKFCYPLLWIYNKDMYTYISSHLFTFWHNSLWFNKIFAGVHVKSKNIQYNVKCLTFKSNCLCNQTLATVIHRKTTPKTEEEKKLAIWCTQILHTPTTPVVGTHDEVAKARFSAATTEQWPALFPLCSHETRFGWW